MIETAYRIQQTGSFYSVRQRVNTLHNVPHPVISQPLPPTTPLRAQQAMTVLTEPIQAWHYCSWTCPDEFVRACMPGINGVCALVAQELGSSWKQDHDRAHMSMSGKGGVTLISIVQIEWHNNYAAAGRRLKRETLIQCVFNVLESYVFLKNWTEPRDR